MLQGQGVQTRILALEEKLQGRQQQGLVKQQRAQLLHALKPQGDCVSEKTRMCLAAPARLAPSSHTLASKCAPPCLCKAHPWGHSDVAFGTCFVRFPIFFCNSFPSIRYSSTILLFSGPPGILLDGYGTVIHFPKLSEP